MSGRRPAAHGVTTPWDARPGAATLLVVQAALTPVRYAGRTVALLDHDRVWLDPSIGVLEADHPLRRFVGMVCLVGHEMQAGGAHEPYDDEVAQLLARTILLPEEAFAFACEVLDDVELAEIFNVPMEQVRARRVDLGLERRDG
jgi:hypothetical protein